jgi:hypothetical protein
VHLELAGRRGGVNPFGQGHKGDAEGRQPLPPEIRA